MLELAWLPIAVAVLLVAASMLLIQLGARHAAPKPGAGTAATAASATAHRRTPPVAATSNAVRCDQLRLGAVELLSSALLQAALPYHVCNAGTCQGRPLCCGLHCQVWAATFVGASHHHSAHSIPTTSPPPSPTLRRYIPWEAAKDPQQAGQVLVVDCTHTSALTITHHKAARNPPGGASDCSTGLVLDALELAARDPAAVGPWLARPSVSVNHFDADAVLSMWTVINRDVAPAHSAGGCRRVWVWARLRGGAVCLLVCVSVYWHCCCGLCVVYVSHLPPANHQLLPC